MTIETPEQLDELKRQAISQVRFYTELANKKHNLQIPELKVDFTLKGTTAGLAFIGKNRVALNPTLLRENPERFLKRTPGHEVAHFATHAKHGFRNQLGEKVKSHGHEWTSMMWSLGLDATRCHTYNTDNVPTKLGKVPTKGPPKTYQTIHGTARTMAVGKIVEFD